MIDRQEKLWLIRQQIAKAISEVDHGDCPQSCLAFRGKCFATYSAGACCWFALLAAHSMIPKATHFFCLRYMAAFSRTMSDLSGKELFSAYWTRFGQSRFKHFLSVPIMLARSRTESGVALSVLPRFYKEFFAANFAGFPNQCSDAIFAAF